MRNWISSEAQEDSDLVLCSKVSLARNIEDSLFTDKLNVDEARENANNICDIVIDKLKNEDINIIKFWENDYINSYKDKLLISDELTKRKDRACVVINNDETISIMVNEVDHLVIQCITKGLNLKEQYIVANNIDDLIEEDISYAFHEDFGYLTATPNTVGTGLRAGAILHIPALVMSEEIEKISKGLTELGMSIKPIFMDGNKPYGNIYEVSNRISLGINEEEIISNLEGVINNIIQEEKKFRDILFEKCRVEVEDKIFRAYGILNSAKLISYKEFLELLSYVRLGVETSTLNLDKKGIEQAFNRHK